MKSLWFAFTLLGFFQPLYAAPDPITRHIIVEKGRYGYTNATGHLVIAPQFAAAQPFSENLAAVRADGLYGFIDTTGRWVIPPQYDYATPFQNGLAIVWQQKQPIVLQKDGKKPFLIPYALEIMPFTHPYSIVKTVKGQGILSQSGKWIVEPVYSAIHLFDNQHFIVSLPLENNEQTVGLVDMTGNWKMPLNICRHIAPFRGDYAAVTLISNRKKKITQMGWMNKIGKIVFKLEYSSDLQDKINGFGYQTTVQDSIFVVNLVKIPEKKSSGVVYSSDWGYEGLMNFKGELILDNFDIKRLKPVGNGLFKATDKNHKSCFIDIRGNRVASPPPAPTKILQDSQETETVVFIGNLKPKYETDSIPDLNKTDSTIWQAQPSIGIDTMDIDYMKRGYFYASSQSKANDEGAGGWGRSQNEANPLPMSMLFPKNALSLVAKTDDTVHFANNLLGFRVYLVNNLKEAVPFGAQDSRLNITTQALDTSGKWHDIEYLPSSWCGNSYHTLSLAPQHFWKFSALVYKGSLKTKLRLKVICKSQKEEEKVLYSNEFAGSVNPGQFWRKSNYMPSGLMDPYND